ER
ncbi:hypothetical protein D030_0728B, partial [Vibrio parahaemolyticus AQ3810]